VDSKSIYVTDVGIDINVLAADLKRHILIAAGKESQNQEQKTRKLYHVYTLFKLSKVNHLSMCLKIYYTSIEIFIDGYIHFIYDYEIQIYITEIRPARSGRQMYFKLVDKNN
jgi:hypothetical protein